MEKKIVKVEFFEFPFYYFFFGGGVRVKSWGVLGVVQEYGRKFWCRPNKFDGVWVILSMVRKGSGKDRLGDAPKSCFDRWWISKPEPG